MNYIKIKKLSDFSKILDEPIYIAGNTLMLSAEIYNNMWCVGFSESLMKKLKVEDLEEFIGRLIKTRTKQLEDSGLSAKFYMFYDIQASQLRFNFISYDNKCLPFDCELNLLSSPQPLLKTYLEEEYKYITEGVTIEYLDPKDMIEEEEEEIVMDVYYKKINITEDIILH